jgi:hypothetical protein
VDANGNPSPMNAREQLQDCRALENNESLPFESKYNEYLRNRKLDFADFSRIITVRLRNHIRDQLSADYIEAVIMHASDNSIYQDFLNIY